MTVLITEGAEAAVPMLEQLAGACDLLDHRAYLLPYAQVLLATERQHGGGGVPTVRSAPVEHLTST